MSVSQLVRFGGMLPNLATWVITELSHLNEESQVRE